MSVFTTVQLLCPKHNLSLKIVFLLQSFLVMTVCVKTINKFLSYLKFHIFAKFASFFDKVSENGVILLQKNK